MRNIVQFLQANDIEKPDFIRLCASEGTVRLTCISGDPMNEEEKETVKKRCNEYYMKNWYKLIMPILRYKRPNVTNVDYISS